jgi:hypothetical protein
VLDAVEKDKIIEMKPIRDYVFPLIKGTYGNGAVQSTELIGTGFLIGKDGFAITAAHVIEQLLDGSKKEDVILALFIDNGKWVGVKVEDSEKHETEDVGIIKLMNFKQESFLIISNAPQYSSCEYHCWGYPHEVAKEYSKLEENTPEQPDLIFTKGYIRRRISRELYPTVIFRGKQFYELSETVGGGNSGAPIILETSVGNKYWKIIGVYIGEKTEGDLSYAVRAEAFASWKPQLLGKTIIEESNSIT